MTYYVTDDEERWSVGPYATREEAIAAGPVEFDLKPGAKFWTGAESGTVDTFGPYADRVIEDAQERAYDEHDDGADTWLDVVTAEQHDELEKALEEVWEAWLDKHGLRPTWFEIDNIEEHRYDGSDLHVFTNDTDHVVARSIEDAWDVWCTSNGEERKDYEGEWTWEQEPDDKVLSVWEDDPR
jgi:hypothetical protein